MRLSTIFPLLALGGSTISAPNSGPHLNIRNPDECKAVTVIISVLSQYKAQATSFCSSFLSIPVKTATSINVITLKSGTSTVTRTATTTPKISVTATTTITPTVTYVVPAGLKNRDLEKRAPFTIPTYLSAFPSSGISSACSCLSITPSTTTVTSTSTAVVPALTATTNLTVTKPPVTTTVEITAMAETTITQCAQPQATFELRLGTSVTYNGTQLKGTYAAVSIEYPLGYRYDAIAFNGLTDPGAAGVYVTPGLLQEYDFNGVADRFVGATDTEVLYFEFYEFQGASGDPALSCNIDGGVLNCACNGSTIFQLCPGAQVSENDLFFGPTVSSGCTSVVLDVVPLCTPAPTAG